MMRYPGPPQRSLMRSQRMPIGSAGPFNRAGQRSMSPFGAQRGMNEGKGLLSRLFQKQGTQQAVNMFSRGGSQSGSLVQGLANPQSISNFLSQTQNVLQTAQQLGPLVQQYGPIIRNLPAMWKIYQGLSASAESGEESEAETETAHPGEDLDKGQTMDNENSVEKSEASHAKPASRQTRQKTGGQSVPKLYIH